MTDPDTETLLRQALHDAVPDPPHRPDLIAGVRRRVAARRRRRTAVGAAAAVLFAGTVALAWPRTTPGPQTLSATPAPATAATRAVPQIGDLVADYPRLDYPVEADVRPFDERVLIVACGHIDAVLHRHLPRPTRPPAGLTPSCYVRTDPIPQTGRPRLPDLTQPYVAGLFYLPGHTSLHQRLNVFFPSVGMVFEQRYNYYGQIGPGEGRRSGIYVLNSSGGRHAAFLPGPPATLITRGGANVVADVAEPAGVYSITGDITPDQALAYATSLS